MTRWVFAKPDPAAVCRDPDESQQFRDFQAGENAYAGTDALVREILQNALDASANAGPVKVRLALQQQCDGPCDARLTHYFQRLLAPLAVRAAACDSASLPTLAGAFLVIEDSRTRGLAGDPMLCSEPQKDSDSPEDFFRFRRNIGLSGKTGDEPGRWGLGKTFFRAVGRVGCMFGLQFCRQHELLERLIRRAGEAGWEELT